MLCCLGWYTVSVMPERNRNHGINHLHEKILYVAADGERKDVVSTLFFTGWIVSGLAIIFLGLSYGRDAAMMALQAVGFAGGILWLINNWWKYKLNVKYSTDK